MDNSISNWALLLITLLWPCWIRCAKMTNDYYGETFEWDIHCKSQWSCKSLRLISLWATFSLPEAKHLSEVVVHRVCDGWIMQNDTGKTAEHGTRMGLPLHKYRLPKSNSGSPDPALNWDHAHSSYIISVPDFLWRMWNDLTKVVKEYP